MVLQFIFIGVGFVCHSSIKRPYNVTYKTVFCILRLKLLQIRKKNIFNLNLICFRIYGYAIQHYGSIGMTV